MREPITAVVLAGGASRRMGREKALLALPDGAPAIAHVLAVAHLVADPVLVAVDTAEHAARLRREAHLEAERFLLDRYPGAGPLGALAGALRAVATPAILALAVDTPLLQSQVLCRLHEVFVARRVDVVMPRVGGIPQPMPAVYGTNLATRAEHLLAGGRRSVRALCDEPTVRMQVMDEDEVRAVDPDLRSFAGANTPEEWQRVLALAANRAPPET
ncbi:MAG TPA: molybdenum cofactor guanylyltransferase [Chloroflexota bacterium]|jgi:molybdopterin-guanine dinucleotide biosynthesis protein A|nr:molybdenum cofactor guanylyltransferase [Chloroflexota bacterium]